MLTTSEPFWPSGVHRPKVINHFEKNIYWVSYQYQSGEAGQYQMKKKSSLIPPLMTGYLSIGKMHLWSAGFCFFLQLSSRQLGQFGSQAEWLESLHIIY